MLTLLIQVKKMISDPRPSGRRGSHTHDEGGPGDSHGEHSTRGSAAGGAAAHLDRLPQGARGTVSSVNGASTPLRQRLMELGIIIGSEVTVIRKAPFGGPIEISVRGYRLSLRRTEAHLVMVERSE